MFGTEPAGVSKSIRVLNVLGEVWSRHCIKGPNDSFQGSGHRVVNCSLLQEVEPGGNSCSVPCVPLLKHALLSLRHR